MARFGFVGPSYTAQSVSVAAQECINLFGETNEGGGEEAPKSYFGTPGLSIFCTFPSGPVRGEIPANDRYFVVADTQLYEVFADKTYIARGYVFNDGNPASLAFNGIQILVVSGGHAYCFTLATNTLTDQTSKMAGVPLMCDEGDTIFVVMFQNGNKFQMSDVLDGETWPGQLVNEVSVFPDNIQSIKFNHRELWVFGLLRSQPYQNTGSAEVFDVIEGAMIEKGCVAPFVTCRADNVLFWIDQDERGALSAWRNEGYTPKRISTHAVEFWLSQQANLSQLVSYAYQDRGHLFWVLYIPGSDCNWVYDIGESMWHKRAAWIQAKGKFESHWSWNHLYAFGKHLVGDWKTGNLYELSFANLDDNGTLIRRLRRAPDVRNEKKWIYHKQLTVDFQAGNGPQPPLEDGEGNEREPEAMLRWSDDGGFTWSNERVRGTGFAGQYSKRVFWMRLGRSRNRVYELSMTDPCQWAVVDAYLEVN